MQYWWAKTSCIMPSAVLFKGWKICFVGSVFEGFLRYREDSDRQQGKRDAEEQGVFSWLKWLWRKEAMPLVTQRTRTIAISCSISWRTMLIRMIRTTLFSFHVVMNRLAEIRFILPVVKEAMRLWRRYWIARRLWTSTRRQMLLYSEEMKRRISAMCFRWLLAGSAVCIQWLSSFCMARTWMWLTSLSAIFSIRAFWTTTSFSSISFTAIPISIWILRISLPSSCFVISRPETRVSTWQQKWDHALVLCTSSTRAQSSIVGTRMINSPIWWQRHQVILR